MKRAGIAIVIVLSAAVSLLANGTQLNVTFGTEVIDCLNGIVSIPYTISSNSSPNTNVTETLSKVGEGVVDTANYTIPANGWVNAGRLKTHDDIYTFQPTAGLTNGAYSLEVCATQPGVGGNPAKTVCSTHAFTVACGQPDDGNPCNDSAPFGEVTGNLQIRENATAQIQFRGDFGATALVEITKDAFYESAVISRAGDSCNYHANWKFTTDDGAELFGNAGPGNYTVNVSGNGNTLEFGVTLVAASGPNN